MLIRALDVAIAGCALAATAPLLVGLAIAIKLDSPGPALFVQERVGRRKRPLRVLKLRTMHADADRVGPAVTAAADPRITRIGAFLRRTKLDELPQLWNVLRGEMSIVGPRPEVAKYAAYYLPKWQLLFDVRPGITDRASVVFRDEEALLASARDRERAYREIIMPMKLELALQGVGGSELREYLGTIARTAVALVRRDAYGADVLAEARRRISQMGDS